MLKKDAPGYKCTMQKQNQSLKHLASGSKTVPSHACDFLAYWVEYQLWLSCSCHVTVYPELKFCT